LIVNNSQIVDTERLEELRGVLSKLDPAGAKAWRLEVYERRNGQEVLTTVIDLKTGQPVRKSKQE
jgi:hypothetical protein